MSFATADEDAVLLEAIAWETSFSSWQKRASQSQPQPSFLSRNARAGLTNMGASISALGGPPRKKLRDEVSEVSDEDEDDLRPAKRRRLSHPGKADALGTDHMTKDFRRVSLRERSKTGAIEAADLYGRATNATVPSTRPRRVNEILRILQTPVNHVEQPCVEGAKPPNQSTTTLKANNPSVMSIEPAQMPETPRKASMTPQFESPNSGGRPRRNRVEKNLNLRAMSRNSLRPSLQHSWSMSPEKASTWPASISSDPNQWAVSYTLGDLDSSTLGANRRTEVTGLTCAVCQTRYQTVENLRYHLSIRHTRFIFKARRLSPPELSFFIVLKDCLSKRPPGTDLTKAVIQLGHPTTLLDVEAYLQGDHSWAKAREGPAHTSDYSTSATLESSSSTSPGASRHSSPNTSIHTNDLMDIDSIEKPLIMRRKTCRVPKTSQPLYEMFTKRVLEPGEEAPASDDEKEEGWLRQKLRDLTNESNDLTSAEKDYISEWNPFMLDKQMAVDTFLPDIVLEFVSTRKKWFLQEKSRKREFFKHVQTLQLRGAVSQKDFQKYATILREAEKEGKQESGKDVDMDQPEKPIFPYQLRGFWDCECCEQTQPPDQIVCDGLVSLFFFYETECRLRLDIAMCRAFLPPQMRGEAR